MTAENRDIFVSWYANKQKAVFDFKQEIIDYCRSDVNFLRHACMRYRTLIIEATRDEGGGGRVSPPRGPLGNFLEGQAHPNLHRTRFFYFFLT